MASRLPLVLKDGQVQQLQSGDVCSPSGAAGGDLTGTYPNPAIQQISGPLKLTANISPSVTGAINDFSPSGLASTFLVNMTNSSGSPATLTGLDSTGISPGQMIFLVNSGVSNERIILSNNNSASAYNNRFNFKNGLDVTLWGLWGKFIIFVGQWTDVV